MICIYIKIIIFMKFCRPPPQINPCTLMDFNQVTHLLIFLFFFFSNFQLLKMRANNLGSFYIPQIKRRMSTRTYIYIFSFYDNCRNFYFLLFLVLILVATLGCLRNQSHVHVSSPCMQPIFLSIVLFLLFTSVNSHALRNSIIYFC